MELGSLCRCSIGQGGSGVASAGGHAAQVGVQSSAAVAPPATLHIRQPDHHRSDSSRHAWGKRGLQCCRGRIPGPAAVPPAQARLCCSLIARTCIETSCGFCRVYSLFRCGSSGMHHSQSVPQMLSYLKTVTILLHHRLLCQRAGIRLSTTQDPAGWHMSSSKQHFG